MDAKSITPELIEQWTSERTSMLAHTLGDVDHCPDHMRLSRFKDSEHPIKPATESAGRGRLGVLPTELITDVILRLDVASLTTLRRVNKDFMSLIDSMHQYEMVYRLQPDLIRDIISTQAKHFDFGTLFKVLCEPHCVLCGKLGGYIYLITCLRVCYICFTEDKRFMTMNGTLASDITGLSRKELQQLPHIRSLPGRYADNGRMFKDRLTIWDREAVQSIQKTKGREIPDWNHKDPRRFMGIISAPYFELPSKDAKCGLYCLGCSNSKEKETHPRKLYTEQEFVDHIIRYGPLKKRKFYLTHAPPKPKRKRA